MLIAQLSDPHVRPNGELYQGVVDSNAQFALAIAALNALDPRPDLVLLSGDLVDHGHDDEYAMLLDLLAALEIPFLAIPGNHDEREAFRRAFAGRSWLPVAGPVDYVVGDRGPVRIVAFDVTLPGLHHGMVGAEGAAWLDAMLAARFSEARDAGQVSATPSPADRARLTQAVLHSLAVRSRAGESRESLSAMAAQGIAMVCGVDSMRD